jgi:hypothetical protein
MLNTEVLDENCHLSASMPTKNISPKALLTSAKSIFCHQKLLAHGSLPKATLFLGPTHTYIDSLLDAESKTITTLMVHHNFYFVIVP